MRATALRESNPTWVRPQQKPDPSAVPGSDIDPFPFSSAQHGNFGIGHLDNRSSLIMPHWPAWFLWSTSWEASKKGGKILGWDRGPSGVGEHNVGPV
jgi:hypothetical protein